MILHIYHVVSPTRPISDHLTSKWTVCGPRRKMSLTQLLEMLGPQIFTVVLLHLHVYLF